VAVLALVWEMGPPRSLSFVLCLMATIALASAAGAQTIYVDTDNDLVDFGGAQTVADLPGPDGRISLPEAGLASDNTPGVQTIGFQIPQSEWDYQWLFPGRAVLRPFLGFRVFDTAILDARTQTAFTGDTNPDGGEVVIWQESYLIDNVGGAVYGFDSSGIHLSGGSGNVIQGNTNLGLELYDSTANLIGGVNPGEGNVCGFIQIDRSDANVVVGNVASRVRVLGWAAGGMPATGNRIGGPSLAERNFIPGTATYNSEGAPSGFAIQIFDSVGTIVENNWIGTTLDGLAPGHPGTTAGVLFEGENYDAIVRNNQIAGILGAGTGPHYAGWYFGAAIRVYGEGSGVTIQGNTIGLDALGRPLLGSVVGISMENYYRGPIQDVRIGGAAPGEGNEIAGHRTAGVQVANTFTDVRIAGNAIHDNGGLGIDLIPPSFLTGVTPNDPLDADAGGNGLQNFPILSGATLAGGSVLVRGTLGSAPNRSYRVEAFASSGCDPSGHGEGEVFLGATSVTTDAAGDASFSLAAPWNSPPGWVVTATATDLASGATSEFSPCFAVGAGLALSASPLQRGQAAALIVQGAQPGERASFVLSTRGLGAGLCPPALGGLCLDLLPPVTLLGSATADASGTATLQLTVPPGAPLVAVHLQAAVRRGVGGVDSVKSNPVSAVVMP
jgi:hypothetical protein